MRPPRSLRAAVVVVLVATTLAVVPALPSGSAVGPRASQATLSPAPPATAATPSLEAGAAEPTRQLQRPDPATEMRVNLTSDGDARWTVTSRFRLENETERAAFRAMVADLREGAGPQPPVGYSPGLFRTFAERVQAATNRSEMAIRDPAWDGTVTNETGRLRLSFTWTNFARTEGDRVLVGDVFRADVGWFESLRGDQRFVISPPPNYAVVESPFPIDEAGTISIDGPEDVPAELSTDNVSVVYASTATPPTGPSTALIVGGLLAVVALVLGGGYLYSRRADAGDARPRPEGDAPAETSAAAASEPEAAEADPAPASDDDAAESDPEPAADDGEDEELLSDEERVERLLADNGGRMKQATIVDETGWSNAKVSQLLSAMDEAGRVDKLRIGRENLISLPEESVVDPDGDSAPTSEADDSG